MASTTSIKVKKKEREYTKSVITSDKWVEFHELKETDKLDKDEQKEKKKKAIQERKKFTEEKKREKTLKKKIPINDSDSEQSESNESWCSNNHSQEEPLAVPIKSMDLVLSTSDLKTGDYILVKFETTNK